MHTDEWKKRNQQIENLKKLPKEQREKINIDLLTKISNTLEALEKDTKDWLDGKPIKIKHIDEYYNLIEDCATELKNEREKLENIKEGKN